MKILIGLGIAVVTLIGVILALPFFIDLKNYQDQYKPSIEAALNRKIDLQEIRLTLWPRIGARVEGFTVLDDPEFGSSPFASLESIDVAVQLRPLLSGHFEVDEITLRHPIVTVIKNQNGVLNVSTVGRPGVAVPDVPSRAPIPSTEGPLRILALLAVDRVSLVGGTMTYRDLSAATVSEYVLQDLNGLLTSVRLGENPQVHVDTLVQPLALPVTLDGRFGPLTESTDIEAIDFRLALGKITFDIRGQTVGRNASLTISSPVLNTAHLPVALPLQQPVEIKDLLIAAEAKGQDAHLHNVSFQVFEGHVKAQGMVTSGPKAPPFSLTSAVQGIQLGPALAAFSSSPVRISGIAGADVRMQGRGFTRMDLTTALEGTAHVAVKDGKLEGANLLHEAVSLLKVAGIAVPDAQATAFSSLEDDVAVKQGVLNIERLLMDSHDFQATGGGTIGFDETLNLLVNLHLSQEFTQKIVAASPVAKVAMNDGRVKLPLTITGTAQAPRYGLDLKHLTGKVQEQVQKRVDEAVGGLLKGTTKPEDLRQQGRELLKGLFR